MKAWTLGRPAPLDDHPLVFGDVPAPPLGPGQVRLRVHACGICRTDLHVVEGDLPQRLPDLTPGHQVAGTVLEVGDGVTGFAPGARAGVAWVHETCGSCRPCRTGRENLCPDAAFTGWTRQGGYAEQIVAPAAFVYPLPAGFSDVEVAPLLCAGIIGYRALRLTGLGPADWAGARVGIYGFGAAGHVALQVARARGADVFVMTRDRTKHQELARELGAAWVGGATDAPPLALDAAVVFAPAGDLVPVALAALAAGGTVVLGGIHMSPIPRLDYDLLYHERSLRSVANSTRRDGHEFLAEAARIPVVTHVETFPLDQADQALLALARGAVRGAAVLVVG